MALSTPCSTCAFVALHRVHALDVPHSHGVRNVVAHHYLPAARNLALLQPDGHRHVCVGEVARPVVFRLLAHHPALTVELELVLAQRVEDILTVILRFFVRVVNQVELRASKQVRGSGNLLCLRRLLHAGKADAEPLGLLDTG